MRFVPLKSQDQSDIQALHRARKRLVSERTALINHLRALLLERGIVVPQGRRKLEAALETFADKDGCCALSPRIRTLIEDTRAEWSSLDGRITAFDAEFIRMARADEPTPRLTGIPGIGTINATNWNHQRHGAGGSGGQCKSLRTPMRHGGVAGTCSTTMTTGGMPRLLGISKRGNRYLCKNLIHGVRAALPYLAERETPLGRRARGLLQRAHINVVVVTLANKLARIAWAFWRAGAITILNSKRQP